MRGIEEASHRARISAPVTCRSGRFGIRVNAQLARGVVLRVDGKRHAITPKVSGGRYGWTLDARRYRPGVHQIAAKVTFLDGTTRTVRATSYRCRAARPRHTG